jgi:hypothetical protein
MNKTKNKFNIVDIFAVLIILALILGTVFFVLRKSGAIYTEKSKKNITYTVCIPGVKEEYISEIKAGEMIRNSSTMGYMGTITKTETTAHTENGNTAISDGNGGYVLEQKEAAGVYDVYITITSKATPDSRGVVYIDSERITIGSVLYVRIDNFAAESFITAFSIS